MKRLIFLLAVVLCTSLAASSQPVFDVQLEAAHLLGRAVENGDAALQNITLYSDLIAGRDVDDQETRLSLLSLAVASASRSVAFIEAYDELLTRADAEPPRDKAESIDVLEQVMLAIPDAAGEAFSAELADNIPIVEIRERVNELEETLTPHLEALSVETTSESRPSRSMVADVTRLKNRLQERLEGDADELATLFNEITHGEDVDDDDIVEMANESGKLQAYVETLEALEDMLGLEDAERRMATNELKRLLHELGDDVAEDYAGRTFEERQEITTRHADEIVDMIRVLHSGAWRTDG